MQPTRPSSALFTDLYELTMAQAYWQSGKTAPATFSLFLRRLPPDRGYAVFAGLEDSLEYLAGLRFTDYDIEFLRALGKFDDEFLSFLSELRFTGSVRAMREGQFFFGNEPVLEVTAPVIEAQLAETYLVNQVSLQSLLATKAARVVHAAGGRAIVDFAARRTQGIDAANKLARASYIVGFEGTSNVEAGVTYGIPTFGTMAHSFVTSFDDEEAAMRAYGQSFPDSSTFLVDTYDSIEGTRAAIRVALEMKTRGHALRAIRLDSGDMSDLARRARALLDEAGLTEVTIFASGGLDEYELESMLVAGAPIDGFGVGTKVGVSADAPWADVVYKMTAYDGRPVLKLSTGKQTLPGPKQVFRHRDADGRFTGDVIGCADEAAPCGNAEPLLNEVMKNGSPVGRSPALEELRRDFAREFASLPARYKANRDPESYRVDISQALQDLEASIAGSIRAR